ncbi:MAG: hypothetical protein CMJ36_00235 [Phycisphaerae bacterium]|nr:hypothetical protein [Phycisphaerae bacterium]
MRWLVDLSYVVAMLVSAPIWLTRMIRRGRMRTDWGGRFGRTPTSAARSSETGTRVLLHAVSVGEVNAIRGLVATLSASGHDVVVAVTTDTGFQRASALFGQRHQVVRYPLDLSWSVNRFLDAIQPDVVALVELEVWPNFTAACRRRAIPVLIINGRLTLRSVRRYGRFAPFIRPMFSRVSWVGAQDQAIADRFRQLGIAPDRIEVAGNMKWDNARLAEGIDGSEELREAMGIDPDRPLVVAGSTAPDEHALIRDAIPEGCQLLCAPRRPEWFDDAAGVLEGCARRSRGEQGSSSGRYLLDTIGELSQAYALADVVIVGRSFGSLHGSDVTEPIGLGVATIVGPAVSDFSSMVSLLVEAGGLVQATRDELPGTVSNLLAHEDARRELAQRGRAAIRSQQGATERFATAIADALETSP